MLALALVPTPASSNARSPGTEAARRGDITWLIAQIREHYAYLPGAHLDLARLRSLYLPQAAAADTPAAWTHVLERLVAELHDDHATLGTNTPSSPQLIPSGTDIWAAMEHGRAIITQVRPESPAMTAGLRAGDQVAAIDGVPVRQAMVDALPPLLDMRHAGDFTLRTLLAGVHDRVRRITLEDHRTIVLPPFQPPAEESPVSWRWLDSRTGYIRLNNSLGNPDAVPAFDRALVALRTATGLILDLRDTPSGGDTDVAKPIMGRFITAPQAYQRTSYPRDGNSYPGKSTLREVQPRGPFTVIAPMAVLVDRWTGSMGEGMAVGFDAMRRATIVGTRMAGLRGGTEDFVLPGTGIAVHFPAYRLYQVDGAPREDFVPPVAVDLRTASGSADPILARARAELRGTRLR